MTAPTPPAAPFRYQRMVQFAETDMAGILHFANTLRIMEEAEHALFRSLGLRVHEHDPAGVWGWARRRVECEYLRPLRYEDVVDVTVRVARMGTTSIDYTMEFELASEAGADDRRLVARGGLTAVCIGKDADGALRARPIPEEVRTALAVAASPDR